MKVKFETWFRAVMGLLLVAMLWGLLAGAQTTNSPNATPDATNHSSALGRGVTQIEEHFLTFGLDRVEVLRGTKILSEPLWKYLASLIYILAAFYVAKLIDYITVAWVKKLATKTQTKVDDLLIEVMHGPLKILAFVLFLQIGLNIFDWSERARLYLSKGRSEER